ncbi:MAG TPA: RsmB/NOP family class I SAM-dependent RNA methyltransferase, partial [Opitutaceae bacterium]|nr:RsmB/NOP family class I SAM-dependent RNA methyltransferase [Opitutaceae bacterium]
VIASQKLQQRFDQDPASIKAETMAARAVPEWLKSEMDVSLSFLRHLQTEPALWIRAKAGTAPKLAQAVANMSPARLPASLKAPPSLAALKYSGTSDLHKMPQFQGGEFEIQDLASQVVGLACAPKAGETWWDACAGEGGKTLHLSDLMGNKGLLWATDRSARRLSILKKRTGRAGVFNYRSAAWTGIVPAPFKTKCDGVLVDAPCSGVGTWQRNPHARWTTSMTDVTELAAVQAGLLDKAALSVKTGGRLVYSVCTLTRSETTAVADAFQASHPDFEAAPIALSTDGSSRLTLLPEELNANGMFLAAWKKAR